MTASRRTHDEGFDLGIWVGHALAEVRRVDADAPADVHRQLATLGDFLAVCRDARNWSVLTEVRRHWEANHGGGAS